MTDKPIPSPEYVINITRRTPNPEYKSSRGMYERGEVPMFVETTVTTCTLDLAEWRKVQRAIVEALQ